MNLKIPIRILYIEDDFDVGRLTQIRVNSHLCKLDLAKDGQEGKEKIKLCEYDAIVVDYHLPDMSCKRLIQDIKLYIPKTVIIVLTGCKTENLCQEVLSAGANVCIEKDSNGDFIAQLPSIIQKIIINNESLPRL